MKERKRTISEVIERERERGRFRLDCFTFTCFTSLSNWGGKLRRSITKHTSTISFFFFSLIWREIANNCLLGNEMTLWYRGEFIKDTGKNKKIKKIYMYIYYYIHILSCFLYFSLNLDNWTYTLFWNLFNKK